MHYHVSDFRLLHHQCVFNIFRNIVSLPDRKTAQYENMKIHLHCGAPSLRAYRVNLMDSVNPLHDFCDLFPFLGRYALVAQFDQDGTNDIP